MSISNASRCLIAASEGHRQPGVTNLPCAKCSALSCSWPRSASISRNSDSNLTAGSERMSKDFMRDTVKVVRN